MLLDLPPLLACITQCQIQNWGAFCRLLAAPDVADFQDFQPEDG